MLGVGIESQFERRVLGQELRLAPGRMSGSGFELIVRVVELRSKFGRRGWVIDRESRLDLNLKVGSYIKCRN